MKDIGSFIVIHSNFAALFVKQGIFVTSSSKKVPKKLRFSCFFTYMIYMKIFID